MLNIKELAKKSKDSLRQDGIKGFAKKSKNYISYKL